MVHLQTYQPPSECTTSYQHASSSFTLTPSHSCFAFLFPSLSPIFLKRIHPTTRKTTLNHILLSSCGIEPHKLVLCCLGFEISASETYCCCPNTMQIHSICFEILSSQCIDKCSFEKLSSNVCPKNVLVTQDSPQITPLFMETISYRRNHTRQRS